LEVSFRRIPRNVDTAPTIRPINPADTVKENVHMRESSENINWIQ